MDKNLKTNTCNIKGSVFLIPFLIASYISVAVAVAPVTVLWLTVTKPNRWLNQIGVCFSHKRNLGSF